MHESKPQAPVITFPCDNYPVKVIGEDATDYAQTVFEIVRRHAPELTWEQVHLRHSRQGRWVSVTLNIRATGKQQLITLTEELKATGRVKMVL